MACPNEVLSLDYQNEVLQVYFCENQIVKSEALSVQFANTVLYY